MAISYLIGPAVIGNSYNSTLLISNVSSSERMIFDKVYSMALRAQIMSLMRIGKLFEISEYTTE